MSISRRNFLKVAGALAGGTLGSTGTSGAAWEPGESSPQAESRGPITQFVLPRIPSRSLPAHYLHHHL